MNWQYLARAIDLEARFATWLGYHYGKHDNDLGFRKAFAAKHFTIEVMQDGNRFYIMESGKVGMIWQAPFTVKDYDLRAADKARQWFISEAAKDDLLYTWNDEHRFD